MILIIASHPKNAEIKLGHTFTGSFGHLLNDMLISSGIDPNSCQFEYIHNNAKQARERTASDIVDIKTYIKSLKPTITILLGEYVLNAILGKRNIEKHRGSIYFNDLGKVMATFDPLMIMKVYVQRAIAELDLVKAKKHSLNHDYVTREMSFTIRPTFEDTMKFLTKKHTMLSFDIETTGKNVRCLGFSDSVGSAICIPFIAKSLIKSGTGKTLFDINNSASIGSYWTIEEETAILIEIDRIFRDPSIKKIAQNFPFDSTVLAREFGFHIKGLYMDTMIAAHCCYSELPKSLDFLTSIYTEIPYYAEHEVSNDESEWRYNCYDCAATFEVCLKLEKEMEQLGVSKFYEEHAQPAMLALTRAGNRGILVDLETREKLKVVTEKEIEQIKVDIKDLTHIALNPNSPKQMKEYLYGTLGFREEKSKVGVVSAGVDAIEKLRKRYPAHRELFNLIINYRKKVKLVGAFLTINLDGGNHYLTSYNATGTKTGRISSSKLLFDEGGNIQQTPRGELRRIFIARPGKVFIKVDLAQAEARAVAFFARDFDLIKNFNNPEFDIHKWNAALLNQISMKGLSTEQIIKDIFPQITKEMRRNSKGPLHSTNYRGGPYAGVRASGKSYQEVKFAQDLWRKSSQKTIEWWSQIEEEVTRTRKQVTPFGRLRIHFDRLDMNLFRSATAQLPQSTVGDQINRAFFKTEKALPKGCYPLIQVHDEIVFEVINTPDKIEHCISIIKKWMEYPIYFEGIDEPLIIPADISIGKNWFDQKEVKFFKGNPMMFSLDEKGT